MRPFDPIRALAVKGLLQIMQDDAFSNDIIQQILLTNNLSDLDKNFLQALILGTIEQLPYLDATIKKHSKIDFYKIDVKILAILRISLWQIIFSDKIPNAAAVDEAVRLTKHLRLYAAVSFVNALLRNAIREPLLLNKKNEHLKYGVSSEIFGLYKKWFGLDITKNILNSYFKPKEGISVLFMKDEQCKKIWFDACRKAEIEIQPGYFIPNAYMLKNVKAPVDEIPGYAAGWFIVQDESSMLIGLLGKYFNGELLDGCAGQGGKSFALMYHQPDLKITALEPNRARYDRLVENNKRLNFQQMKTSPETLQEFSQTHQMTFQQVLLDVPCSGLGVVRSKPEIKIKATYESLQRYPEIQKELIKIGSRHVAPNGRLIYSTCTVNPEENQAVIRNFLDSAEGKAFEVQDLNFLLKDLKTDLLQEFKQCMTEWGIQIRPDLLPLDGFYICCLRKRTEYAAEQ